MANSAIFADVRRLYAEMGTLHAEIRALEQEMAATIDPARRAALQRQGSQIRGMWDALFTEHAAAMTKALAETRLLVDAR